MSCCACALHLPTRFVRYSVVKTYNDEGEEESTAVVFGNDSYDSKLSVAADKVEVKEANSDDSEDEAPLITGGGDSEA